MNIVCWNCGKVIEEHEGYIPAFYELFGEYVEYETPNFRKYCKECRDLIAERDAEENRLYIKLKKKRMLNKACFLLEKQDVPMYDYKEAIEVVKEVAEECPDKFDSSYEMIAAIVLVHNHIYSKMQYKIGHYQVDFLLPEIGVVLEIDGDRHRYSKGKDKKRDAFIKNELGYGWDIIRIPTTYLDKQAVKLVQAIERVIDYRETGKTPWRKIIADMKPKETE